MPSPWPLFPLVALPIGGKYSVQHSRSRWAHLYGSCSISRSALLSTKRTHSPDGPMGCITSSLVLTEFFFIYPRHHSTE